jgi:hypothetical protein
MLRSAHSMRLLLVLLTLTATGCTRRPAMVDEEKETLELLVAAYDAKVEYDEKGRVERLQLEGPHVDDAAVDQLAHFKMLKRVSLRNSSVTDAAMPKLRDNKRLNNLGITGTRVTDKGLKSLVEVPSLRQMWVTTSGQLTHAGVDALKKALPGLTIHVMNEKKAPPKEKKE